MANPETPSLPRERPTRARLARELKAARLELQRLRSAPEQDGDRSKDDRRRALERRIRDIEREIERRELAAEIERQSDA